MTDDEKCNRIKEIWHHPDLKTMSKKRHDALGLELESFDGIGGASDFQEMCGVIRKNRRRLAWLIKRYPRIRNLPTEEQGPFREWLMGQTQPGGALDGENDFYYQHDYDRWKVDHNAWNM